MSSHARHIMLLLKFLVAAGLIGLVLWMVPIGDRLFLPQSGEGVGTSLHPEQEIDGKIQSRDGSEVVFITDGGERVALKMAAATGPDENLVVSAKFPDVPFRDYTVERGKAEKDQAHLEEGILTVCENADIRLLLVALVLILAGSFIAIYRWNMLLNAAGLVTGFVRATSLTFIGLFFNNVMPGLTGGDLVKAVYIAREHSNRKTEAIITVLLDRMLGITGLALVAAVAIPVNLSDYGVVAPWIYGFLIVLVGCGIIFFSRRLRAAFRVNRLLERLPLQNLISSVDQAVFLYRYRKGIVLVALLLSVSVHLVIISGVAVIGTAMHLDVPIQSYFAIVPIGFIVMALPISPAGLGTGEAAFVYFWSSQGVSGAKAVSLLLVYRMAQLLISLAGGMCLASQKDRVTTREVENFAEDESESVGGS